MFSNRYCLWLLISYFNIHVTRMYRLIFFGYKYSSYLMFLIIELESLRHGYLSCFTANALIFILLDYKWKFYYTQLFLSYIIEFNSRIVLWPIEFLWLTSLQLFLSYIKIFYSMVNFYLYCLLIYMFSCRIFGTILYMLASIHLAV